jgi:nicotinamide-nucleotide amidase
MTPLNEPVIGFEAASEDVVVRLAGALRERGWRMATAESCTGGMIAAACTALAGSSDWFDRGVVSYSNAAKTELLGVPPDLLAAYGAVSEPVARAMAGGILQAARVQACVAVTGIAGPGGAVPGKPVGTVWLAWAVADPAGQAMPPAPQVQANLLQLGGDRKAVRQQTVLMALQRLLEALERGPRG